jgi:hypothetical protein
MSDVIPSFYRTRSAGEKSGPISGLNNTALRTGYITKINYPEDTGYSFVTYNVSVDHKDVGGDVSADISYVCILASAFGGLADKSFYTLRETPTKDKEKEATLKVGSMVLILCIDGVTRNAVILGGARNEKDTDKGEKDKGHHAYFVFNGVKFGINDDGSWQLEQNGPTKVDGTLDTETQRKSATGTTSTANADSVGTVVKVESTGNLSITTKNGKAKVIVNHQDGSITLESDKINIGSTKADQKMVLGNKLKSLLEKIIDTVAQITVPTSSGPSGMPINSVALKAIKKDIDDCLSDFCYTKKSR